MAEDKFMKNVLLICNYFAPENEIASIRLSKFAKYLREYGYQVCVLAEKKELKIKDGILLRDVAGIPVQYVENSLWLKKADAAYMRLTKNYRERNFADVSSRMKYSRKAGQIIFYPFEKRHPAIGTVDYLIKLVKQYNLYRNARGYLKHAASRTDVCISTYGGYFGHFAGNYAKRQNRRMKWIADFRDPVYRFNFDPALFAPAAVLFENWACLRCDEIVTATKGMAKKLPRRYWKKLHCITNGFDREEKRYHTGPASCGKFVISYTGRMYGGMQDVSVAFQAIRELADEGTVDLGLLEFHYAGTGFAIFRGQAAGCGLESCCVDYGSVEREASLAIQSGSNLLLMAVWDYKCQTIGALTGKILEYMQHDIPVIAIINGDVEDNELARVVRGCGLGIAYEQSHHARDIAILKGYIRMQYLRWQEGKGPQLNRDRKQIAKYEYRYLTKKLIRVIEAGQ